VQVHVPAEYDFNQPPKLGPRRTAARIQRQGVYRTGGDVQGAGESAIRYSVNRRFGFQRFLHLRIALECRCRGRVSIPYQEAISFTHSTPKSGNEWGGHTTVMRPPSGAATGG
jgi:hypothetical protein